MKPKVGRNFTSERGEGVKGEIKNISLHWLQCIFETVPKLSPASLYAPNCTRPDEVVSENRRQL